MRNQWPSLCLMHDALLPAKPSSPDGASDYLDLAAALRRLGGDRRLLAELAALFLAECPHWLAEMDRDLRLGNTEGLAFTAHRLRGALSWFGPSAVFEAARALEWTAQTGDLESAAHACAALETALHRTTPALAALASPTTSPAHSPTE